LHQSFLLAGAEAVHPHQEPVHWMEDQAVVVSVLAGLVLKV
jgi:hypothetical protein